MGTVPMTSDVVHSTAKAIYGLRTMRVLIYVAY